MNLLIAEDQPLIQHLNRALMNQWGFEFDIVDDGMEAVAHAQRNDGGYDLCVMDVEMPRLNGIEAIALIRKSVAYLPILALTSEPRYQTPCLEAGADDFATKPCAPETLLRKIRELTVKASKVSGNNTQLSIGSEKPMNQEQLKELRELEKKGLALLIVESGSQRFVVHKNIQNKMSHVLIGEGKELFEFLDRGENPANCHLYKASMQTNRLLLTPEQFASRVREEDSDMERYSSPVDKGLPEDKK